MRTFPRYRVILVLLAVFPLTGCLFRSRRVERQFSAAPLKSATQAELIDYVNDQAAKIKTLQATVDIDTSVGGVKPSMLRMIGLMPIVRNRAFDMVSDGRDFKLWIPPKNRFVVGRNDIESHNVDQPLENLRPQHIYDALILR